MFTRRMLLSTALASAPSFAVRKAAFAQTYPSRPIKVIVPFPAGGPTDAMARIVSDRLSATLKQSIVVENRGGGAGGSVGAKAVMTADPDGYTVLLTPPGPLTVGPAVFKSVDYDPLKAFVPVGLLIVTPLVMCIAPSVPVKTLAELVAYAKANPGKIIFGSQGYGTAPHLLTEMLKLETGVNIVHVPYRGTNPAITDLLAGEIQMFTDTSTVVIPQIEAGKLRALAVTTPARSAQLPDVPTTAEAGFPKLRAHFWLGVVAPAGTPADIVSKLNAAFNDSLRAEATRTRLIGLGAEIRTGTPQEFAHMLADELAMWQGVTTAANLKVD
jgi:tripartite-type tricarboxylate transporter receptor subunit TctC